ncbi:uncharacterized protein K444DRAFT_630383 [Hyaloscypha bicolor E]|uniref:Uncharacterized protein n=1 Tax=Hyaloscypha bicolor E TaxID=1095630 RepID=A0A2J6T6N9_9HELO|nr:uncharacterized protein K444DRAFT_630383 [Hyaloscypha bicolor E]PMD58679.1 hypothetical protein K444DRAFT_630383 [Hyaloscypha bicolor E]
MDFLRYNQIYPNSVEALPHKLLVIRKLNEVIANGGEISSDDIILAILVLVFHETLKVTEEKRRPFNFPLRKAQWLNIYGHIKSIFERRKAVLDLPNLRGGLETFQIPGLAKTVVGFGFLSLSLLFPDPRDKPTPTTTAATSSMIFGVAVVAVVAPLPNTYDMLQIYVSRLKAVIGISSLLVLQRNTSNCASQKLQYHLDKFLLWGLVLGGIASLDKPERAWFVEQLKIVKEVL